MDQLLGDLRGILPKGRILLGEPMSRHTTFQIGGGADYFVKPCSVDELRRVVGACRAADVPYCVLGKGSNMLVSDAGYRGVVIDMGMFDGVVVGDVAYAPGVSDGGAYNAAAANPVSDGAAEKAAATKPTAAGRAENEAVSNPASDSGAKNAAAAKPAGMPNGARVSGGLFATAAHDKADEVRIIGGAGLTLSRLTALATARGLSGLEFAAGIPGTLGGATVMNAGAYGCEMKDVLTGAVVLTKEGEVLELDAKALRLGYRSSCVAEQGYIVLEAILSLHRGDPAAIRERIRELTESRKEKQPISLPSAGSTFKRPKEGYAAKLIEDAGMRGARVGGAQVSEKHCGFVVNVGDATAADVIALCTQVEEAVMERFGVALELEIKVIG
ncbi:MAG: UDP-N-acetylmuramate dehydrogenase [Lachnospiraceae bacterium]|jgi:UDP-N-acetylenolpyruvoylglucosamine reductase|nr:UDP-N-acetylmuramate dehydrogenase [Lachnospiraceae bacterium]